MLIAFKLFTSFYLYAGLIEIGANFSLKDTTVGATSETKSRSVTGSLAYYFMENSAIEFSYTEGYQRTEGSFVIGSTATPYTQVTNFNMYGADFILSYGGREAVFRPYVKLGTAYQEKEVLFTANSDISPPIESKGQYITYGAGFRYIVGQNWALRVGYDRWKGPLSKDDQSTDSALRAGISFIF